MIWGFLNFKMHKYNFDSLKTPQQTKLCGPPEIFGGPPEGGVDPRLGTSALYQWPDV